MWIYHVIAKVYNKEYIFRDNIDKETKKGIEFNLCGYTLMDNQYHFIKEEMD